MIKQRYCDTCGDFSEKGIENYECEKCKKTQMKEAKEQIINLKNEQKTIDKKIETIYKNLKKTSKFKIGDKVITNKNAYYEGAYGKKFKTIPKELATDNKDVKIIGLTWKVWEIKVDLEKEKFRIWCRAIGLNKCTNFVFDEKELDLIES